MNVEKEMNGFILSVNGPVVIAQNLSDAKMYDMVKVGAKKLVGEIIGIHNQEVTIQVYEETAGLQPGEPVETTHEPLSVELGPGLISNIFDGTQRPLEIILKSSGNFIARGVEASALDRNKKWDFKPLVTNGTQVQAGDIIGETQESTTIVHKVMIPPGISGTLVEIKTGSFTVVEPIATIQTNGGEKISITMLQRWPVRTGRPFASKLILEEPLITGQRVIDLFFPIAKGGVACIPGPFGSGKTVVQHQLAKWANADVIIHWMRRTGNEMTDVLMEFPELIDPIPVNL